MVSPLGELLVGFQGQVLYGLDFGDYRGRFEQGLRRRWPERELCPQPLPVALKQSLEDYFAGDLAALQSLPVEPGGTPFQQRVWQELRRIPPAQVVSYGELARRINCPRGVRAVGLANGRNPIAIAIPCHRVVGSNGALTGYAGGLGRKRWLLAHEGAELQANRSHTDDQLSLFASAENPMPAGDYRQ